MNDLNVVFVAVSPAEIDILVEFMRQYYLFDHIPFDERTARIAVSELVQDPRLGRAWLIKADGSPVGYVFLAFGFILEFGGRDAFVDELYLAPEFRGRGIGELALAFVEKEARLLGLRALRLEVSKGNLRAIGLYHKAGFEAHDRLLMTKVLNEDDRGFSSPPFMA